MWSNMAGSGAWSVAMNMIEYAAPLGCFGCLQESSCPKTIWYLLPRRSDCTIAMRITWMLQRHAVWYIWWYCKCLQILALILELQRVMCPTETDPTSPKRSLVRDDGMKEKMTEASPGDSWDSWEIWNLIRSFGMNDWITILQFHCWYDTTEVEIPIKFQEIQRCW